MILNLACVMYSNFLFSNLFHFIPLKNCWLQVITLISEFTNEYFENSSYRYSLSFSPVRKFHSTGGLLGWASELETPGNKELTFLPYKYSFSFQLDRVFTTFSRKFSLLNYLANITLGQRFP